ELAEIEPIYYERPYYLAPDGDAARKPYTLLVRAMERTGKAALAKFVMRTKEYLAAIRARDGVLLLNTMNYADEVVDPADIEGVADEDVQVTDRELDMAEQLIGSLTTDFEPENYRDEHHERVMELLRARAEGEDVAVEAPTEQEGEVIDLMQALEASLGRSGQDAENAELEDRTKDELYELAQEADISGRSDMTKDELVAALREHDRVAS
ncbi:MAG: Ku protein, partial [Actinobacteria bacterium]|nr:Ku protein [Actinomycetota bacterium]